jgi:hypothetical protein
MDSVDEDKQDYKSPQLFRLGPAADMTFGNGDAHPDWLGNPLTKYGPLVPDHEAPEEDPKPEA